MENKTDTPSIMHTVSENNTSLFTSKLVVLLIVVALIGLSTGFFLAKSGAKNGKGGIVGKLVNKSKIATGSTYGSTDTENYKDITEGVLKEGGIEGEGEYHLVRPGGDSQNVYLTSSLVDLSQFIDRKIKVWGQTQKAQKAGWLMDVGKVEVLN